MWPKESEDICPLEMETQTLDIYAKRAMCIELSSPRATSLTFAGERPLKYTTGKSSGTSAGPEQMTQDHAVLKAVNQP
jgi:hypothetical protein